jgi:hypothetical protein
MTLQFIHDNKGNTTGVFIPIEEWQSLKTKYTELEKEEAINFAEPAMWQKQILDNRLTDYYENCLEVADFDKMLDDMESAL